MIKKILKTTVLFSLCATCLAVIVIFEINDYPVGSSLSGIFLGLLLPPLLLSFQDLTDNYSWKAQQRKLQRADCIKKDTLIRISFSYLFRIKSGSKYLLVQNSRNTGKYQPVGGVYKFYNSEKKELKLAFHYVGDDKIPEDASSKNDYRLCIKNKHLRKFVRKFNTTSQREKIEDLSREFKEELTDTNILSWDSISYRYCGRHITGVEFSPFFQTYELLIADIVELIPTDDQFKQLKSLEKVQNKSVYKFATSKQIMSQGVESENGKRKDWIANHTFKILEENEENLLCKSKKNEQYTVKL